MIIFFSSDPDLKHFYHNLLETPFEISLLISESPKPKKRSKLPSPNPAHQFALENDLETLTPDKLNREFTKRISTLKPTLGIVFAYGKLIPNHLIDVFKHGIINIHPSLLPKYRGPSPIQTALLNNDKISGYSIIKLTRELDAGDIIFQEKVEINHTDDYNSLKHKIITASAEKLPRIIKSYLSAEIKPVKQNQDEATYTKLFSLNDAVITNSDSAQNAYDKIRAFSLWPKARIDLGDRFLIIHEAELINDKLNLKRVQLSGKSITEAKDLLNGYPNLLTKLPSFVSI